LLDGDSLFGEAVASHPFVCLSSAEASIDNEANETTHQFTYAVLSVYINSISIISLRGLLYEVSFPTEI